MQSTCVIGGGPAGVMLGLLLARGGLPVIVLEKHEDFFRDFRGDTIHPSTLELMYELGLLEKLLQIRHTKIDHIAAMVGGERFEIGDLTHLPTHAKYVALMPQWDLLNFLSEEAARYQGFILRMGWEATGLIEEAGVIRGVRANTPDGPRKIRVDLTVGCDGRHAVSRQAAHLPLIEEGVPIDVLWFRISRRSSDPEIGVGYVNYGRLVVLINRIDYFQTAYLIAKGGFDQIQQEGLDNFRAGLERIVPFLAGRAKEIDSWEKVKLLSVQINRLERWSRPGLLCIGDAAHAMSPVGGIGINIAVQDAVAAANLLTEPLRSGTLTSEHLEQVQRQREGAVRNTQRAQVVAHGVLNKVLHDPGPIKAPALLRIATSLPGFQRLAARFVGIGLQPQHIRTHPA
ncbi:MAG: FAD-dependent oxidoreductase [Silvibacterium sp.]|nr:FAD-dependent oxidoreductase [Silvibacterium sp.]